MSFVQKDDKENSFKIYFAVGHKGISQCRQKEFKLGANFPNKKTIKK